MTRQTAADINILGRFCGKRDVEELTTACLRERFSLDQADVMVLFGGSILAGGDILARAMKDGAARKYIIVGGAGHTTETLRSRVRQEYPDIETADQPEAVIFDRYLARVYGLHADALETASTNCGNNITFLLDLLRERNIPCRSIILCQDATMQARMEAGLRRHAPGITCINYAAYRAEVTAANGRPEYTRPIHGMWDVERYVNLLMGEIPRLTDDAEGYGPAGKDFIAHVEIPAEIRAAFQRLQTVYGSRTREANPLFASRQYPPLCFVPEGGIMRTLQ